MSNLQPRYCLHPERAILAIAADPRVIEMKMPHRATRHPKIGDVLVVEHNLDNTRILRNLGYDIPSPILKDYDWCGQTPFESQKITATMLTLRRRAYVLNEMGTGKTRAALFAFDYLKKSGAAKKMLVIAPLSTLDVVWGSELFNYFPHLEYVVLHGTRAQRLRLLDQQADIYIINHDGVKVILPELVKRPDIDVVLFDELAVYRNKRTERWKTAERLLVNRKYAWGMTGGPTPKEPTDAWAQIRLLTPENTTWSFKAFRDQTMYQVTQFRWEQKENALEIVHAAMQPSVRFKRSECIDLPPTTYGERMVPLTAEQDRAYKQMQDHFYLQHPNGVVSAANAGVQANKLVQIACGFAFQGDGNPLVLDHQPRVQEMLDIIQEADAKVIVFAPYIPAIKLITDALEGNFSYGVVTGDTPQLVRNQVFSNFQKAVHPHVLVAHPKVTAHGLTLTAADTILWYGVLPDLEIYDQACARVARPGQVRHTHILHLVSTRAERKIVNTLKKRGNMQSTLLNLFRKDNR